MPEGSRYQGGLSDWMIRYDFVRVLSLCLKQPRRSNPCKNASLTAKLTIVRLHSTTRVNGVKLIMRMNSVRPSIYWPMAAIPFTDGNYETGASGL